jgi:hypothetical protein
MQMEKALRILQLQSDSCATVRLLNEPTLMFAPGPQVCQSCTTLGQAASLGCNCEFQHKQPEANQSCALNSLIA